MKASHFRVTEFREPQPIGESFGTSERYFRDMMADAGMAEVKGPSFDTTFMKH